MIIDLFEAIFGCLHRKTTFPQGKMGFQTVTCLECGHVRRYLWDEMRIGQPIQVAIAPRSGAVQSPILDKETNTL